MCVRVCVCVQPALKSAEDWQPGGQAGRRDWPPPEPRTGWVEPMLQERKHNRPGHTDTMFISAQETLNYTKRAEKLSFVLSFFLIILFRLLVANMFQ